MILSFKNKMTKNAFNGESRKGFPADLLSVTRRRLRMVHRATSLEDLRFPHGNGLEALKNDRNGQQSIRVNDQFRICFVWRDGNAHDVEFTDHH